MNVVACAGIQDRDCKGRGCWIALDVRDHDGRGSDKLRTRSAPNGESVDNSQGAGTIWRFATQLEANMARITVEDCLQVVDNRFELVLMATRRARQLENGVEPTINPENDKPTVLALREIADRTVDMPTIDEIDRVERERRDREALEWAAAEVDEDMAKGLDEA